MTGIAGRFSTRSNSLSVQSDNGSDDFFRNSLIYNRVRPKLRSGGGPTDPEPVRGIPRHPPPEQEDRFRDLLEARHPLGAMPTIAETLRSVAHRDGDRMALAVFSAADLQCGPRCPDRLDPPHPVRPTSSDFQQLPQSHPARPASLQSRVPCAVRPSGWRGTGPSAPDTRLLCLEAFVDPTRRPDGSGDAERDRLPLARHTIVRRSGRSFVPDGG